MSEHVSSPRISRRSLLRGGAAAAAVAVVGLPLSSCTTRRHGTAATSSTATTPASTGRRPGGIGNVHVSRDHYGCHIEPSVAANPRHPRQLLAACQASHTANPQFIATYLSFDAGATWQNGALPQPPAHQAPASDDVTVAFDPAGPRLPVRHACVQHPRRPRHVRVANRRRRARRHRRVVRRGLICPPAPRTAP
jgi:hypothetical protein